MKLRKGLKIVLIEIYVKSATVDMRRRGSEMSDMLSKI